MARAAYLVVASVLALAIVLLAIVGRKRGWLRAGGAVVATVGLMPLTYTALAHAGVVRETYVRFYHPPALVLTAALGIFLGWRLSQLSMGMAPLRRALVHALSAIAVFASMLAVAEPELGRPLDRLTIILVVDRSRSIDLVPGADVRVRSELKLAEGAMQDEDRVATVVFGSTSATEDPPRPRSDLPLPQRIEVGRDGTDLEGAIRRALSELPSDSAARIVLVTDGVQTRGDALSAAAAAVAADVPIDVVVLEQRVVPDVRVVAVRAPARANEGEAMDLRVVTSSAVATDIELRVKKDDRLIRVERAHIGKGEDVVRIPRELASEPGLHRYDVEVTALDPAADGSPEDNVGSAFVRVRGPAIALILEGDVGHGAPLAKALREGGGFKVEERSTTGVPADVGGLAGFDLVVLSDIRASDLGSVQIDALASYARDLGGGLVLMGGDRSMGPGGYARTSIEEVSPVAFDLKQEKRRASLAEVIAIDFSGSMSAPVGTTNKLGLANEAAARSASLLGPGDRLAVEHVDTTVHWTVPMSPVTDPARLGAAIRAVQVGGGGIYTDIALQAGYEALEKEKVNLRHLLLFADGSDAEQITGCRAQVKDAFAKGITTSVISLGKGHDSPELEVLSKLGGGRFYLIEDATKLPAVFSQETILAAKSSIHEGDFQAKLAANGPATRALDFARAPPLKGYVVTVAKPRASVLLSGPENDPILATWPVGIGHVAAFASDFKDRWGQSWLGWASAGTMFVQLARDVARKPDDPRVRIESDASGGELHVRADVVGDDGRAQTFRRLTVHVAGPDGFARDVPLDAVGAGRYAASIPLSRPGTYVATAKDEVTNERVGTTGAVLTIGEELRPTGSDGVLLSRIAGMTGGKVRPTLAGLFEDRAARRFAYTPLEVPLVIVGAVAMLLGVGARRLGVPTLFDGVSARMRARREARAKVRAEHASAQRRADELERAERQRLHDALLARKQRSAPSAGPVAFTPGSPPAAPPTAAAPPPAAPPEAHSLSAAERLAIKRRERR